MIINIIEHNKVIQDNRLTNLNNIKNTIRMISQQNDNKSELKLFAIFRQIN